MLTVGLRMFDSTGENSKKATCCVCWGTSAHDLSTRGASKRTLSLQGILLNMKAPVGAIQCFPVKIMHSINQC